MTFLHDQDYADDISLPPSKLQDAQQKAERVSKTVNVIGLNVNTKNIYVQRKNTGVNNPLMID